VGNAAVTVNPEDESALKLQLARLADDEQLRQRLRAAGLKRAWQFDWQRTAIQTLEVYTRAVRKVKIASDTRSANLSFPSRKRHTRLARENSSRRQNEGLDSILNKRRKFVEFQK